MPRERDEIIKAFIKEVGTLFDARAKGLEINIKAHVNVKASKERLIKQIEAVEQGSAELKKVQDHGERIEAFTEQ